MYLFNSDTVGDHLSAQIALCMVGLIVHVGGMLEMQRCVKPIL